MMEAETDAWEEVVASLLDRCEGATREHRLARWHFACVAWIGAAFIGMLLWVLPMSGRRTLTSITVAICLVGIGEGWRRYGFDIPWGRTVDLLGSERPPSLQPIPNGHSGESDARPVLLQKTAPTKSADDSSVILFLALGSLVKFNEGPRVSAVKNSFGVVTGVSSVDVTVTLAGGARVEKVRPDDFVLTSLDEVPGGEDERNRLEELMLIHVPTSMKQTTEHLAPDPPPHYAPLTEGTQAQHQAKSIKELLVLWHGKASLQPTWARSFWAEVGRREPLEPRVRTLLLSHGYLGKGEKLEELSIAGALAHTTSAFRDQGEDPWPEEAGLDTWDAALPPDLKRAGPEIYTSMKSAGVRCVRDWINSMFSVDQRQHPQYVELFNLASLVDFKVKDAGSPAQVLSMIGQCDTCEIALRRLASWIHEKRTGDKDAAQSMLAVKPSSFASDIAPSWLVTEASTYSQSEYKRKACHQTMIMSCCSAILGVMQQAFLCVHLHARPWVHFLNFLYSSKWHGSQRHFASDSSGNAPHAAEDVLLRQLWRKAKLEREGRRQYRADAGTGGRSAAAELVKNARFQDGYCRILKSPSQVPLCASRVAEPNDDTFVDMLTALPQVEADFYAKEGNCIDWTGKSRVIQSELEEQYGFVGHQWVRVRSKKAAWVLWWSGILA
ncbi:unnamed protein product, partial [Symbiodinium sp. CCMP2456]